MIAAEVGHLDLAYDYFAEAARVDLDDLFHNTNDGLHIASLAGAWMAAVAGFGGFRDHDGKLSFAPRLPGGALQRLAYPPLFPRAPDHGRRRAQHDASYTLLDGKPLDVAHHGEQMTLVGGRAREAADPGPRPRQGTATAPGKGAEPGRPRRTSDGGSPPSATAPLRAQIPVAT